MVRPGVAMIKETYTRWNADKAPRLAAALSYSTIFAIAPIFVIVVAIVGQVLGLAYGGQGHHDVLDQMLAAIRRSAGPQAADMVRQMVTATFGKPHHGLIATIVGWVMLVVGAVGLFAALQDALNTVWHVEPAKKSIVVAVRNRLISAAMLLAIGFLLLLTTALNAAIAYVSGSLAHLLPFAGAGLVFAVADWVAGIALTTLLFAMIYKFLPDAEIAWADVWIGAFVTAVGFVVGQSLIGLYLGRTGVASAYGAAGALLALLLWIYYSAMILLFGAEFTHVYAERRGTRIVERGAGTGASADEPRARPQLERLNAAKDPE